ncbi:hypothetical protein MKEN_00767700 [Mycena kentingensis (nom. inval.)]|nr:hypothetical protein MKEN_00767700 [Mycena kentingensis (nom. inval.)]
MRFSLAAFAVAALALCASATPTGAPEAASSPVADPATLAKVNALFKEHMAQRARGTALAKRAVTCAAHTDKAPTKTSAQDVGNYIKAKGPTAARRGPTGAARSWPAPPSPKVPPLLPQRSTPGR